MKAMMVLLAVVAFGAGFTSHRYVAVVAVVGWAALLIFASRKD